MSQIQDKLKSISKAFRQFDTKQASFQPKSVPSAQSVSSAASESGQSVESDPSSASERSPVRRSHVPPSSPVSPYEEPVPSSPNAPTPPAAKKKRGFWIVVIVLIVIVLLVIFGLILYKNYKKRKQAKDDEAKKKSGKTRTPFEQIDHIGSKIRQQTEAPPPIPPQPQQSENDTIPV